MRKVSVALCCFNGANFVLNAMESLYRQTLPLEQYEVIFVNDGSTDETEEIALGFQRYPNLRYFKNPSNLGLAQSCNRGIREAQGEYLIRLDADDTFEPTILEELCEPLDRGITDLVSCDRWERIFRSDQIRLVRLKPLDLYDLIAIGTLMRRDLLLEIGGYRDLFLEEVDLYLRYLLKSGRPLVHIPKPLLTYYVQREGSLTADPVRVQKGWQELHQIWPQPVLERFGQLPVFVPE